MISISPVATSVTAFVGQTQEGPVDQPVLVHSFAAFQWTFGGLWTESPMTHAVQHYFLNGGGHALIIRITNPACATTIALSTEPGGETPEAGEPLFNLLCIPPFEPGRDVDPSTWSAALATCKKQGAILLVDPPSTWREPSDVVAGLEALNLRDENGVLYFPRVRIADPPQADALRGFPSCGAVAGVIARTDAERGVWRAPAGPKATLMGVQGLAYTMTDSEHEMLNRLGVNGLRTLPTIGHVVWGARTLAGIDVLASEWKYLPVRRLALFIEQSIDRGTQWARAERNRPQLWAEIRRSVEVFMQDMFRQGAFQGARASDAYYVRCGAETTTARELDRGLVNVVVGFAPLKPAEFVTIEITKRTGRV